MSTAGRAACAVLRLEPDRNLDAVVAIEAAVFPTPWTKDMLLAALARLAGDTPTSPGRTRR